MDGGWGGNYRQPYGYQNFAFGGGAQTGGQDPYRGYASGPRPRREPQQGRVPQYPQGYNTAPQRPAPRSPQQQRRNNLAPPPRPVTSGQHHRRDGGRDRQPRRDRSPDYQSRERRYPDQQRRGDNYYPDRRPREPFPVRHQRRQREAYPDQRRDVSRERRPRDPSPERRYRDPSPVPQRREALYPDQRRDVSRERRPRDPSPERWHETKGNLHQPETLPKLPTSKQSFFQRHDPPVVQPETYLPPPPVAQPGPHVPPRALPDAPIVSARELMGLPGWSQQPSKKRPGLDQMPAAPLATPGVEDIHFAEDFQEPEEPKPPSKFKKWLQKLMSSPKQEPAERLYGSAMLESLDQFPGDQDAHFAEDFQEPKVKKKKKKGKLEGLENKQGANGITPLFPSPETVGPGIPTTETGGQLFPPAPAVEQAFPPAPAVEQVIPTVPKYVGQVFPSDKTNGHVQIMDNPPVRQPSTREMLASAGYGTLVRMRLSARDVDRILGEDVAEEAAVKRKSVRVHGGGQEGSRRKFATETRRSKLLGDPRVKLEGYKKWKYQRSKQWQRLKVQLRSFFDNFTIWNSSFKSIEGHFGTSIVSYFTFVKWLLKVNLFVTLVILGVVVFPQEFMEPDTFVESLQVENATEDTRVNVYHWEAYNCSVKYDDYIAVQKNESFWYKTVDFFQGTGWMEQTVLFMGYYFNKTYVFDDSTVHYNMPLGYLLCTAAYLAVTLIFMVNVAASGMKARLVDTGDKFYNTCNKMFCSWDYGLSREKAAMLKHRNIYQEFSNDLEEQKRAYRRKHMSRTQRCGTYSIRVLVNLLVLALLGASGYLIYKVTRDWMPELLQQETVIENRMLTLLVEFLPSITLTVLNVVVPPVFQKVVIFEDYSPEFEIKITIVRTVALRLASIAFLVVTLIIQITCKDEDKLCGNCIPDVTKCWETYFGQQFYKLVILDFLVIVGVTFFVEFPRKLLVSKFPNNKLLQFLGLQEFEIPVNVLDIVYSQTLCWIGGFFSPLLPAITVIKFFIFFYVKKLTLMKNCIPSARPYRASRSSSFFMTILMVSFVLCVVPIVISIGRVPPSQSCGPFRVYSSSGFLMYNVITDAIDTLNSTAQDILYFIGSYLFYVPMIVILCLVIYYYQAMAAANKRMGQLLREQLAMDGKDKQFLLARVNDALQRGDFDTLTS